MKKTKLTRSLLAACSIVALTAVMYGCVHDGDSDPVTDDDMTMMPEPTDVDMSDVAEGAAAAAGTYTVSAGGSVTAGDVTFSCAAGGDPCTIIVAADGSATSTGGSVTADDSQGFKDAQRADDLQDELDEQGEKAAEDAAKAKAAKLNRLATGIGVAGASIAAPDSTEKPTTATDGDAPQSITGWTGSSYSTSTGSGSTQSTTEVVVYNNKGPATSIAFNKKHMLVEATETVRAHLTLDGATATAATRKLVSIPNLPTNPNHPGVTVGPSTGTRGTFDGVSGLFTAPGSGDGGRDVTVDVEGDPTWTGDLRFTPDSVTATVSSEDSDYMSLGWWLTTSADGTLTPQVDAWATGDAYDSSSSRFTALLGKATFEGIAVGKYTYKTINSIEGGHFNADAELVADFDVASTNGTLTGTIDNFMSDGESIGSGWKVQLGAAAGTAGDVSTFDATMGAAMTATGTVAALENGALGTFGTQKTLGTWEAEFVDNSRNDPMPGGVIGGFHIGQLGHPINMIGAFAASNQEADAPSN